MNLGQQTVECVSIHGNLITWPREKLVFRPSAYAIILHDNKVLMLNTRSTGKYSLPGGGVDLGQRMEDALQREVREETGLRVSVGTLVGFKEEFFYYDPLDQASHSFLFFYLCRALTFELLQNHEIDDDEVESPAWLRINQIRPEEIQGHTDGYAPATALEQRL